MLSRENLAGIWAGLPTPFTDSGDLDVERLAENIHRVCQFDVGGVYGLGGAGEFYALELDEFKRVTDTFVREGRSAGKPVQIGVTWSHTRGVIQRMAYAQQAGVDAVQVAFPYWFSLSQEDAHRFFRDITAACPGLPIVHYNSAHAGRVLDPADYQRLENEMPELIGTKFLSQDAYAWQTLTTEAPRLAHFTAPEMALPTAMMYGARGGYSIYILVVPELMLRYYRLCQERRWDEASAIAGRIAAFFADAIRPLLRKGYADCALDKATADMAGLLLPSGDPRPPYCPLSPQDKQFLRAKMREHGFSHQG